MSYSNLIKINLKKYFSIFLMIICSFCLCLGQLVWNQMAGYNILFILLGFVIYFAGALAMILAYRHGELSVLQPINSMSYVFATFIAIFILHEKIPLINIIGILLIISGVIVIGRSSR